MGDHVGVDALQEPALRANMATIKPFPVRAQGALQHRLYEPSR